MADIDDYLQDGFDPRSVTMPRLRSILVTHNVEYPATAKKAQLVELVTNHVLSQASKLRAQKLKAKRSSMGIVNAGSAEDDGRWDDSELMPSASVRRSKTPRKSSSRSIKAEDDELVSAAYKSPSKRDTRSVSKALLSHADERELSRYEPSAYTERRSRRTVTPQVKVEEPDSESEDEDEDEEEESMDAGEESVFTDDNPFQSGSSPLPMRTPSGRINRLDMKDSAQTQRVTDAYLQRTKTPRTSNRSVQKLRVLDPEIDAGEEFTPDEQLELEDAARKGEVELVPRKSLRKNKRSGAGTPLLVLLTTLIGAYVAWYRQEKIAVGYCGLGRPAKAIIPPEVPVPDNLVPFIEPQCEQCPQHAYCYEDFSVRCENDFILRPHPLSLGGLVPLPPTCEPDGEKARRVHSVADRAVEELREIRAKFECGELKDENGHNKNSPSIPEEELKATVSKKRSKRLSSDEFEELWAAAIGEVTSRDEVQVDAETPLSTTSPGRKLSSSSLARLPISCAIKRSIRLGLERNRLAIGLLVTFICSIFYIRGRYRKHMATSAQIPALVDTVLGRLLNQKELGDEEVDDPWLFLPNLRDDVLRAIHSLSEREKIWRRVRSVVEQNSNVRTSQREGRSGEVGRAWEWIGPVAGDVTRRRRSGRVSFGPDATSELPEAQQTAEMKRWEDSRPIY